MRLVVSIVSIDVTRVVAVVVVTIKLVVEAIKLSTIAKFDTECKGECVGLVIIAELAAVIGVIFPVVETILVVAGVTCRVLVID